MYKDSDLLKPTYKLGDIANMLGVTTITLKNWEKAGRVSFSRTKSNIRFLDRESLINLLDSHGLYFNDVDLGKKDIIYARVSSYVQKKNGDLDRQVNCIIDSVSDLKNIIVLKEVGSGLNDRRKELLNLINMVMNDEVGRIFITHKDRLTGFGFNYLDVIFKAKGVELVVIDDTNESLSIKR